LTFEQPVEIIDKNQVPTQTWMSTGIATWGSFEPLTGNEVVWPFQVEAESPYRILCRYQPGILQIMRIRMDDRLFNIVSVQDIGHFKTELEILATEMKPEE